jgi:hypothetical protein
MLILVAAILLFLAPTAIVVVYYFRPEFRQIWLSCVIAGVAALFLSIFAAFQKPGVVNLFIWKPEELFPISPVLLADRLVWRFSTGLISLLVATLLVSVTQKDFTRGSSKDYPQWLGLLYLASLTIFSLMAGNLLTLIFVWTALDIAELLIWLAIPGLRPDSKKLIINLLTRFTSLYVLFFAGLIAFSAYLPSGFEELTAPVRILIYAAWSLRILVLPFTSPLADNNRPVSLAMDILQIMPFGAYLILLARLAQPIQNTAITAVFIIVLVILASGFALLWAFSVKKSSSLPNWLISTALLCFCASILAELEISMVWGLTVIISGGLLYLYFSRRRTSRLILYIGLFNLSALPLSATWLFVNVYADQAIPQVYLLFIPIGIILAGYFKFIVGQERESLGPERWMLLIYPSGLLLLPLINLIIVWYGIQLGEYSAGLLPSLNASWPALIGLLAAGLVWLLIRENRFLPYKILPLLRKFTSLGWLYKLTGSSLRLSSQVFDTWDAFMEGRGGIFWSLLLLTLVFALLYQS